MRKWEREARSPGKGNSKCKGPEVGACLVCLKDSMEAGVVKELH